MCSPCGHPHTDPQSLQALLVRLELLFVLVLVLARGCRTTMCTQCAQKLGERSQQLPLQLDDLLGGFLVCSRVVSPSPVYPTPHRAD